ncbi:thiosulfate oxidation carrier protein SoxY [Acidimangrovimonas sediminis]|uniref:thiosulfate oxidation carrier protein SoxY n=1 Tax=Acidimangrovimonas sediminis TaxID=2056283 RepID=UPI000C7FBB59|nr:thiosulfate oxidation carrier protein SoxY [Acidimangrovimonas sediminis]
MTLTRREALILGAAGSAALMLPLPASAAAFDDAVKAFTGGATPKEGGVTLNAPEIAENGNTVPVSVEAKGASEILILAPENPTPKVATFSFGPLSGGASASTRMRLAKTQDVTAIAKMADGSFAMAKTTVKVTIGGCGG